MANKLYSKTPSVEEDKLKQTMKTLTHETDTPFEFNVGDYDTAIAFFVKRGFDENAAISTAGVLLQQSKLDNVKVFELLDTLQGLESVQLSAVVTEILNYNRLATSTLGYKVKNTANKTEKRNIIL